VLAAIDRTVFVAGPEGLTADALGCAREHCVAWRLDVAATQVVASAEHLFVATDEGVLSIPRPCGRPCEPDGWVVRAEVVRGLGRYYRERPTNSWQLQVLHDTLAVQVGWDGAAGSGAFDERMQLYPVDCAPGCEPTWIGRVVDTIGEPVAVNGALVVPRLDGVDVFANCPGACLEIARRSLVRPGHGFMFTTTPAVLPSGSVALTTRGCVCGADGDVPVFAEIDPADGDLTVRARFPLTRFLSAPVVIGGAAFVGTDDMAGGHVFGFGYDIDHVAQSRPVATLRTGSGWGRLLITTKDLLVGTTTHGVVAFDPACRGACDPAGVWNADHGIVTQPLALGDVVLVGVGGQVVALSTEHLTPEWTWTAPRGRVERITVAGSTLLVSTRHDDVYVVDPPRDLIGS
jgi:hypothetical protein